MKPGRSRRSGVRGDEMWLMFLLVAPALLWGVVEVLLQWSLLIGVLVGLTAVWLAFVAIPPGQGSTVAPREASGLAWTAAVVAGLSVLPVVILHEGMAAACVPSAGIQLSVIALGLVLGTRIILGSVRWRSVRKLTPLASAGIGGVLSVWLCSGDLLLEQLLLFGGYGFLAELAAVTWRTRRFAQQ